MRECFCEKEQKECLLLSARTNTLECLLNFISQTSEKESYIFCLEAEIHYTNFSKLQVRKLVYASDLFKCNKDIKLGSTYLAYLKQLVIMELISFSKCQCLSFTFFLLLNLYSSCDSNAIFFNLMELKSLE